MKRKPVAFGMLAAVGSTIAVTPGAPASASVTETPADNAVPIRTLPAAGTEGVPAVSLGAAGAKLNTDELRRLRAFFGLDTSAEALRAAQQAPPDPSTGVPLLDGESLGLDGWMKAQSVMNVLDEAIAKSGLEITSLELAPPTDPGIVVRLPGGKLPDEFRSLVPAGVELRVLDAPYTLVQLQAQADERVKALEESKWILGGVRVTAVAVEPTIARVELIVEPSNSADAVRRLAEDLKGDAVGVRVQHQPEFTNTTTTTDTPTMGGQAIMDNTGSPATACADAFSAYRAGTRVMVTAKHCFTANARQAWYTRAPNVLGVGYEIATSGSADADSAAIGNRNDLQAKVYRPNFSGWSEVPVVKTAWSNGASSGQPVFLTAVNEVTTYVDWDGVNSFDITTGSLLHSQRASLCTSGGDSGGPVYTNSNGVQNELAAAGVIASSSADSYGCQAGEETAWSRINLALLRLDATIITG